MVLGLDKFFLQYLKDDLNIQSKETFSTEGKIPCTCRISNKMLYEKTFWKVINRWVPISENQTKYFFWNEVKTQ